MDSLKTVHISRNTISNHARLFTLVWHTIITYIIVNVFNRSFAALSFSGNFITHKMLTALLLKYQFHMTTLRKDQPSLAKMGCFG